MPTKKNWQSWKLDREIRRSLTRLIARRSDEAEAEEKEEVQAASSHSGGAFRDLLGAMINAGERKKTPTAIPVADMLEECKTFFFAGKQTTTNLLAWATVLLAMHPEWQERARREVLDVCGPDELPSKEHLPKLKTVSQSVPVPPRAATSPFFLPAKFLFESPSCCRGGISVTPVTTADTQLFPSWHFHSSWA